MIYLDWASTTPLLDSLAERLPEWHREYYGNPSSIHFTGRKSDRLLTDARARLAAAAGCLPEEVVFTSGATEANNMVLYAQLFRLMPGDAVGKRKKIILSGIEHPSVHDTARQMSKLGFRIKVVNAAADGAVQPEKILAELDGDTLLVTLMLVSNETGVIQPVEELTSAIREYSRSHSRRILVHTDAVQAFGKIPFNFSELGVDSAALSAHKIQGPKGVGALLVRRNAGYEFLYRGGTQEGGRRPGTENVIGNYAFALAAEEALARREENHAQARALLTDFCRQLEEIPAARLIPTGRRPESNCSPFILKLAFPPIPGEVLVRVLEDNGLLVSTGSACSSQNKTKLLRVLLNMQVPAELASSSLRISLGPATTAAELSILAGVLKTEVPKLRRLAG